MTKQKLRAMLHHYEQRAAAIRLTMELLDADPSAQARRHRAHRAPPTPASKRTARGRTAVLLQHFDTKEPRPGPPAMSGRVLGSLVRYGYLKRAGNKRFLRTTREFTP